MKNTGITYTSAERSPVILPEMAELLPPLSAEQLDALEADLIKNGCYAPIIVNEDMVIIDGHNRQALCEKHDLPYTMAVFSFEDLLEAKQWALDTQKGRRNLEKWELGKIALKLKPEIEAKAKANMAAGGQNFRPSEAEEGSATLPNLPSVEKAVDTRKELAEAVGLGERTMGKVMQIDENAPDAIKEALDKKELSINKGYDLTRQLQDVPEDQREQAAVELLEYEKAKKDLKQQNAEIDRRGKVANLFCKAYEKASLLTATEENVRCWTEGTRMTLEELQDTVKESREIAQVFAAIADIIEQKILPADWRNTGSAEHIPCEVASCARCFLFASGRTCSAVGRFRIDPVKRRSVPDGMTGFAAIRLLPAGCSGSAGWSWESRSLPFWTITMSGSKTTALWTAPSMMTCALSRWRETAADGTLWCLRIALMKSRNGRCIRSGAALRPRSSVAIRSARWKNT